MDFTLRVWDLGSGQCLRTLEGDSGWVLGVGVTPDGRWAVSSSGENMRVWDLESGRCLRTLTGNSNDVGSVNVTPDGRRVVSGGGRFLSSEANSLRVWDLESGQCLRTLEGHTDKVNSVSVTPDGRRAVSGSDDHTLRVWDLESGQCLDNLEGHTDRVNGVSVTLDGRRAVSGGDDHTLRVWDLESGQCLGVFLASARGSATASFSGRVLAGTASGELLILELRQLPLGAVILTAQQLLRPAGLELPRYTARCSVCGKEFAPSPAVVAAIQAQSGTPIPKSETRNPKPEILSRCPHCGHALRFNPFIMVVDPSDEAHEASLRRGLAHCRQTPGDDESTLGHLTALAVHLEKMGKSAEAAEFQREHDALAAQLAAKKI
jgi:DNA-directed RNA polymerase subunit RPC12/RpoP